MALGVEWGCSSCIVGVAHTCTRPLHRHANRPSHVLGSHCSAVAGEAAGIALGLLCCGSGGERVAGEALAYAHDTQHEKIIRGACVRSRATSRHSHRQRPGSALPASAGLDQAGHWAGHWARRGCGCLGGMS